MILQALNEYYERMTDNCPGELSEFGFEHKAIPVVIELTEQGTIHQISIDKDRNSQTTYIVPKSVKRASGINPNFFWDTAEYALGLVRHEGNTDRVKAQHEKFAFQIYDLDTEDSGIHSLKNFLKTLNLDETEQCKYFDLDYFKTNPNVSFKLSGDTGLICERHAVRQAIKNRLNIDKTNAGLCLITGNHAQIQRLHPVIKGVRDARSTGANIVSINNNISNTGNNSGETPAFSSYKKQQGYNSPVSELVAFNYTTSLNYLLRRNSQQRIQIGDATTVFWSERGEPKIESAFYKLMAKPKELKKTDDPNKNAIMVKSALQSFYKGSRIPQKENQRFFVLGLSPNAARISIRFWKALTIKELSANICGHYEDIAIIPPLGKLPELPLPSILSHLCLKYDLKNLPPNLSGEVVRSILDNRPYPYTVLATAIRRNKAEQEISFPRAAIIKAYLNRQIRQSNLPMQELIMALDKSNTDIPYVLGRWVATLEKIQRDAHHPKKINTTIIDKFYGAISTSPASVFSVLDRQRNHHLKKLKPANRCNKQRLLEEIIDKLPAAKLPTRFSLQEQGEFAIGYYHQRQDLRQDFFKKSDTKPDANSSQTSILEQEHSHEH